MKFHNAWVPAAMLLSMFFAVVMSGCGGSGSLNETASITMSSNAASIYADGASSVAITASVTDSSGVPVPQYTDIRFKTTNGRFRNGSQTYTVTTSDQSGTAVVSLIAPSSPGFAEITCESSGVTQFIRVDFLHYDNIGLPVAEAFDLSVQYHNLSGLWIAGLQNTIWAHLGDEYGNAVQDGVPVSFKTYNTGGFFDPDTAVTGGMIDESTIHGPGTAYSTLFTTPSPAPAQGMVSVTAETDGGPSTHVTAITVTPGYDSHIIYAGTNGGGVYKSTDSGRNWENISRSTLNPRAGQNWIDPYIKGNSAIAVDPDDHNTVYVGTGYLGKGNIFRSFDGGMNWNSNNIEQWNGLYNSNTAVLSVLCDDGGSDYVWMGTEGQGILYAEDGENFQPSGGTVSVTSLSGKGQITSPRVGYSAKNETWTLTCFVPTATVNAPSIFTDIDPVVVDDDPYAPPPVLTASNPDTDGRIGSFSTSSSTKTESWTAKYIIEGIQIQNIKAGEGKGTVIDIESRSDAYMETWTLTCIHVDIDAIPLFGDAAAIFTVESSISGRQADARLNTPYTSEKIDFTIITGQAPFVVGDVIQFDTVQNSYWQVSGSVSGPQAANATTGRAYSSDRGEIGFTIVEGRVPFSHGDFFTFQTYEAKPAYWTVEGSVSGMQSAVAQTGQVYTSDNNEIGFTIENRGAAFSDGDQFKLQVTASKISHGWSVWDFVKVPGTHGPNAVLYAATTTGIYKSGNGGKTWDGLGRFTGDFITCLDFYHDTSSGRDILYAGTQNAGVWTSSDSGITWIQYSDGMEKGTNIRDILLDRYNHRLYAVAWYPPRESATGRMLVVDLNQDYTLPADSVWQDGSRGLSGGALYALAIDDTYQAREIYSGGEGINFYRASAISAGLPEWVESNLGLSNTIMARIPVLFSGEAGLWYQIVQYDNLVFLNVYIQDVNGNPPIAGSTYSATFHSESAGEDYNWDDLTYPDTYSYRGTYRDPGNAYTNNPYRYRALVGSGDEITLTYVPLCGEGDDRGAGCSGSEQTYTISF
ncbi:MAG: hypothetical protein HQK66_00315 [Desulfamplus sp.]|nr:hypothetical protein [Desulfamplus sp.]